MPRKIMTPSYYRTTLRSRSAIAAYLASVGGYYSTYGRQGRSYFSFNVKCYDADLAFGHLIQTYRSAGYYGDGEAWLDNPEWREKAQAKYEEVRDKLFDWAVEDASSMVTDSDCYNHLFNGTRVEVEYAWMGRSGGYLGIGKFETYDFSKDENRDYWHQVFRGNPHRVGTAKWIDWDRTFPAMNYPTLRRLYSLVVMIAHDFTPEKASTEVEHHAAFSFIENVCSDIPRYDSTQRLLPLTG